MFRQLLLIITVASCVAPYARAGGDLPPRIISLGPPTGTWIVDQVGLSAIEISFDAQVDIPPGALIVRDANQAQLNNYTAALDPSAQTLTLTFDAPVMNDRLTVVLDYSITGGTGLALDGEIQDPADTSLPSGDDQAGGQAVLRFTVIQGDVDRNGTVDSADGDVMLASLGRCSGETGYDATADLNLDGCVNVLDAAIYLLGDGALPVVDGIPPAMSQVVPGPATSEVTLSFTEALSAAVFEPRSMFLIDDQQALLVPTSAQLASDGLSATYDFGVNLVPCANYKVNISNALSDASDTLLARPNTPPTVGAIPSPPAVDRHVALTATPMVAISGTTVEDATIEIEGPEGLVVATTTGTDWSADVPLAENQVNHLFVTAVSPCDGSRSGPSPTQVTHDNTPPEVFIDYPQDGVELTTETTDVAGRVGDLLSGFLGLTVTVNGVPAVIDIGQGTNGTFIATDVPLNLNGGTQLQATAADILGNEAHKHVNVVQLSIPDSVPSMVAISGDGGEGQIETVLSEPLIVEVRDADNTPYANKLLKFKVTRSNGKIAPTAQGPGSTTAQVLTNSQGRAEVYWRLGSDAGCGNNRVEVTAASVVGTVVFTASATPGPAAQINIGSGNNQLGETGTPAAQLLDVWVSDGCNGIAGVPVEFSVVQGGGSVDGANTAVIPTSQTGHAAVSFDYGFSPGNQIVEATFAGNSSMTARFTLVGLVRDESQPTTLAAIVLDNASQPIQGAESFLHIGETTIGPVVSDINGRIAFTDIPESGAARLEVDGHTAVHVGGGGGVDIAPGSFPSLAYELVLVPNAKNGIGMPVLLPRLKPENAVVFDNTQDVELTVAGMPGLKLRVKAGSMTRADGSTPAPGDPATLSVNQVHFDEVPMPPPDGAAPLFVGTLQPAGSVFDPPIEVRYPNLTGLPPGSITYFYSFDHDTHSFEIVATGRISDDGACITTDDGSGIAKAGWFCNCPPYAVTGSVKILPNEILDEDWVVSINGQVVQANSDGSVCIDNIAASDQDGDFLSDDFHRLIGYSTAGEDTLWFYTEPFQIAQGVIAIDPAPTFAGGDIALIFPPPGESPPVPEEIQLTAGDAELEVGSLTALVLTGIAPDGSLIQLTTDVGTTYNSSNEDLATVVVGPESAEILAVGTLDDAPASTVSITAIHDGITSTVQVVITNNAATTTIDGRIMMGGVPVENATVMVGNSTTRIVDATAMDGTFSTGTFTASDLVGLLTVVAEKDVVPGPDAGYAYLNNSAFPPLSFPTTDVGDLEMQIVPRQAEVFVARKGAQVGGVIDNQVVVMTPGTETSVAVWLYDNRIDGKKLPLNAYQLTFLRSASPGPGATGTVTYVGPVGGKKDEGSLGIDFQRIDWVFEDQPVALDPSISNASPEVFGVFYATITGLFTLPAVAGGVHYLCEFDLAASADACGEFTLEFSPIPPTPALFGIVGEDYGVSVFEDLSIVVEGGSCE